jgi:hypothetical protein
MNSVAKLFRKNHAVQTEILWKKSSASWRKMKDEQCRQFLKKKSCSAAMLFGKKAVLAGEKMKNKQCYKIIQKKLFSAARFFSKKCIASWRKNEGLTVLFNYSEKIMQC